MKNIKKEKQTKYRHIKKAERLEIAILLKKEYSIRSIAFALGKSPSAISREVERNSINKIYDPRKANHKAYVKRKYSKFQGMKVIKDNQLRNYVENNISQDWSPEEISGRIKNIDKHIKYASKQGIYKFIYSPYGRNLEKHLRHRNKKSKKRIKVKQLENRIFIDKRSKIINNRGRFGDWEGDFIVSGKNGKGALLVIHERKARYTIIKKISFRSCNEISHYLQEMLGIFIIFNSLTLDNDIAFRKHKELSEKLGIPIYFCHPYHSWEKGSIENTNKLIRQYIPKSSDISKYTNAYIKKVEIKLNNRPRKCLGYKTPLEIMKENNQFKTLENFGIVKTNYSRNININRNKKAQAVALEGVMYDRPTHFSIIVKSVFVNFWKLFNFYTIRVTIKLYSITSCACRTTACIISCWNSTRTSYRIMDTTSCNYTTARAYISSRARSITNGSTPSTTTTVKTNFSCLANYSDPSAFWPTGLAYPTKINSVKF